MGYLNPEALNEIAQIYVKLELGLLNDIGKTQDSNKIKFLAWALFFSASFHNVPLIYFMSLHTEHPNPLTRMWANQGLETHRQTQVKHLWEDKTAWN